MLAQQRYRIEDQQELIDNQQNIIDNQQNIIDLQTELIQKLNERIEDTDQCTLQYKQAMKDMLDELVVIENSLKENSGE